MVHRFARLVVCALAAFTASFLVAGPARAQVVGENVNMVSGTRWPGGDPFLQRQNEPTLAVSSVNSQHLMAGANDYRSVDVPDPAFGKMVAGDAWLGTFKSLDGGQTWKSVLLPGYPQDVSAAGLASPLRTTLVVPATFNADATQVAQVGKAVTLPATADPVMRAGTDGLFYYLGINFARDKSVSRLFVARYLDLNNKENGDATAGTDPIEYLDTQTIARSTDAALNGGKHIFIDKPWMAVDVPRGPSQTCLVPDPDDMVTGTRSILAGTVYVAWAQFTPNDASSDIMLTWSTNCGVTWVAPRKLNTVNSPLNQGVAIAIEPVTGRVYVAWRRVASPQAARYTDAIMVTRSEGRKRHFAAPRAIAKLTAFDLNTMAGQARTQTMPSMAISSDGSNSWAHVAWAARDGANGPSRVWLTSARIHPPPQGDQDDDDPDDNDDETRISWTPAAKIKVGATVIDAGTAADDLGHAFSRGHQYMPALTASQGKLVLFYYDSRFDHLRRTYAPYPLDAAGKWTPDGAGKYYREELIPIGELADPALAAGVFGADLNDGALTRTRHTIDVRVGLAAPGLSPAFTSELVSRFPFGLSGMETRFDPPDSTTPRATDLKVPSFGANPGTDLPATSAAGGLTVMKAGGEVQVLQQLQLNIPGFPMFKGAGAAFMGDYIDIQGQNFVAGPNGWSFNTAASRAPVFHAVWTSNQDVKVPFDASGVAQWARYTPVTLLLGTSPLRPGGVGVLFDGGRAPNVSNPNVSNEPIALCDPATTGSRDQNIYTARITEGLQVSTPQNAKVLNGQLPVGFVIAAANTTGRAMTVTFGSPVMEPTTAARPDFSYANDASALQPITVQIAPHASVYRTLFVRQGSTLHSAPTFSVTVAESVACGTGLPACRAGTLTFNPPVALASLVAPEGAPSTASGEIYLASVGAPNVSNPNVSNPNVSNPNVSNPNVSNPNVSNPNVSNPNVSNPNVSNPNVSNPNVSNPNVSNPNVSNPNVSNPNVSNPNVSNAAVADLTYPVTNDGNTTTSYHVKVVGDAAAAPRPLQLIVSKTYRTPAAVGCELKEVAHDQVVVSVPDVPVVSPGSAVSTGVDDPNVSNATLSLVPGETALITLRGYLTVAEMARVAAKLTPAAVPAAVPPGNTVTYQDWGTVPGHATFVKTATATTLGKAGAVHTATVAPAVGPGGMVSFIVGADVLAVVPLAGGSASFTPAVPLLPAQTMVAIYSGDATYATSSASAVTTALLRVTGGITDGSGGSYVAIGVSLDGIAYDGATVTVNGGDIPRSAAGSYTSTFTLPVPGQSVTLTVTGGGLTAAGSMVVPQVPTITAPAAGSTVAAGNPLTVSWTSPSNPDSFDVEDACSPAPCALGGGQLGSARSLDYPVVEAGDHRLALYASNWMVLSGDVQPGDAVNVRVRTPAAGAFWDFTAAAPATWTTGSTSMAAPRFNHVAGYDPVQRKVFVVGGMADYAYTAPIGLVEAYDPVTGAWSSVGSYIVHGFFRAGAVIDNGVGHELHLLGGQLGASTGTATATHDVFDMSSATYAPAAPLAAPRSLGAAGSVGSSTYLIGGVASGATPIASVEWLGSPATVLAPLPTARWGVATASLGGLVYALGGFVTTQVATVEYYNPVTDTWTSTTPLPQPLAHAAAAVVNGRIWVMGGTTTGSQVRPETYVFDPATTIWSNGPPLPFGVSGAKAVEVNGTIHLIGGDRGGANGAQGLVQILTP